MSSAVIVGHAPRCDMCRRDGIDTTATHDGKTRLGPWAYMCDACMTTWGTGLGTGRGQRLVVIGT